MDNKVFQQHRNETFDQVIRLINGRIKSVNPSILLHLGEMSAESLNQGVAKEVWSLFLNGIQHLKDGAPDHQPGSMTEALSRMSLRSSSFAAALGVKPPQFEKMYFSVDYTNGHEAALFFCHRLIEAAMGDLSKSKQIIQQRMLLEKPAGAFGVEADKEKVDALKRQMAFSFNILSEGYAEACKEFKADLEKLATPVRPKPSGQGLGF